MDSTVDWHPRQYNCVSCVTMANGHYLMKCCSHGNNGYTTRSVSSNLLSIGHLPQFSQRHSYQTNTLHYRILVIETFKEVVNFRAAVVGCQIMPVPNTVCRNHDFPLVAGSR